MVGELPASVSFGTVTARFVLAVTDSADGGTDPDGNAAAGTVTFTPSVTKLKVAGATPPTTVIPRAISCTLDSDGIMNDGQGSDFVKLIATDDADLDPVGWTWNAAVAITGGPTFTFDFAVPAGGSVDLTTLAPADASEGNSTLGHSERSNETDQFIAAGVPEVILWPISIVAERGGLTHNSLTGVWTVGVDGTYLVIASLQAGGATAGDTLTVRVDATPKVLAALETSTQIVAMFDSVAGEEIDLLATTSGDTEMAGDGTVTIHRLA